MGCGPQQSTMKERLVNFMLAGSSINPALTLMAIVMSRPLQKQKLKCPYPETTNINNNPGAAR
jgi:hypothetical protein